MKAEEDFSSRIRGMANSKVEVRPGITYGGKALWPLEGLGTAMIGAAIAVLGVFVLLRVVLG